MRTGFQDPALVMGAGGPIGGCGRRDRSHPQAERARFSR